MTTYSIGDSELNIGSFSFNTFIDSSVPGTPNFCGDVLVEAFYDGNLIQDTYVSEPLRTDSGTPISSLFLLNNDVMDAGTTVTYKVKISLVSYPTFFLESEAMITYPLPMLATPGSNTLFEPLAMDLNEV